MSDELTITRWRALLIGVRDYEDPSWRPLQYAVNDVVSLASMLQAGGYEFVRTLHSDGQRPDITAIDTALDDLTRGADSQTLLLVYFAGHGSLNDERAYLLPCNRINGKYDKFAVGVQTLEERLANSGARAVVLILDACHSGARVGAREHGDSEFVRRVIEQAQGMVVLSASNWEGFSWEDDDLQHGIYTHHLVEALHGKARDGRNPYITTNHAHHYVTNQVSAWAEAQGHLQTPTIRQSAYGDPPLIKLPPVVEVNPFTYGNAIRDPARFYGRKDELRAIVGRAGAVSAQSISIVGERRMGKSSLLWQVKRRADILFHTGHRYIILYFDLSGAAGSSNRALMASLRREFARTGLSTWDAAEDGDLSALSYVLADLESQHPDVRLVLLLDELEHITTHPREFDGLLEALRADGQLGRMALVTASRAPLADLCAQGRITTSPFFNIFTQITLGPLDEEAWRALLQDGLGAMHEVERRFIEANAGRHPFLTQMACAFLWEARRAGTVDYTMLQLEFERQTAPHRAYWACHQENE